MFPPKRTRKHEAPIIAAISAIQELGRPPFLVRQSAAVLVGFGELDVGRRSAGRGALAQIQVVAFSGGAGIGNASWS